MTDSIQLVGRLRRIVGDRYLLGSDNSDAGPFLTEQRGDYESHPLCVVLPADTGEVSQVITACADANVTVVPQGGNTGLCGGAVAENGEVILSLKRLRAIRHRDQLNGTITVEAGCVLADIQAVAHDMNRMFPVSLGAEGSCLIGGIISTNAGGINVLRYGNTRSQVLGLEVVLADGRVWDGLTALLKNNTGYDLKQLFIGAEGTLGIVTAATLRLYPQAVQSQTILLGFSNLDDALQLLILARQLSGDQLSSFELIPDIAMQAAANHVPGCDNPLETSHPWYILCQFATSSHVININAITEAFLARSLDEGWLNDAVISGSESQEKSLWKIREAIVAGQRAEGKTVSHDVSVPVSKVPELISRVMVEVQRVLPGTRPYPFGHIGDGNIHCNLLQPVGMDPDDFVAAKPALRQAVYGIVTSLNGSFSAEHGIGLLKLDLMRQHKNRVELDMMRTLKKAIDPDGLMNSGKII
ncbi:MAG: D-2-hydroxyacid dehydrogenase [marine bacterium B5-7]|nr:MAG: D-2-hydroxyacid dehydrogenase [marine bacterium B5-7]